MTDKPDVLLLIGPGCPHCSAILEIFTSMVKNADIGRLNIANLASETELAAKHRVRSVPWFSIGQFKFTGLLSPAEVAQWVEYASDADSNRSEYYSFLLEQRQIDTVITDVRTTTARAAAVIELVADPETPLAVRIGATAVLEDLDQASLAAQLPAIQQMAGADAPQIRADAAHLLSLTGNNETARRLLMQLVSDGHPDVREIAQESLAELGIDLTES